MVSRENRIIGGFAVGAIALVVAATYVVAVLGARVPAGIGAWLAALGVLLFVGLVFIGPQAYLAARVEDGVPRRARIRFGVGASALATLWAAGGFRPPQNYLLGGVGVVLFVGLVVAEFRAGYRATRAAGE